MEAVIITIGDELLNGQTVNTNASWMGQTLNTIGVTVAEMITISDDPNHITTTLDHARKQVDIILFTGGLGPTRDDLTRNTLCDYFGGQLILDEAVLGDITTFFDKLGREMTDRNRDQAMVPDNCTPIRNPKGTAPGMLFMDKGQMIVSMPGVPFEMMAMMEDTVMPEIQKRFELPVVMHRHVNTIGIGESWLADMLVDFEQQLPEHIKLAYLPSKYKVRLRLSSKSTNSAQLQAEMTAQVEKMATIVKDYLFSYDDETLELTIGRLLQERSATMGTAESCTGGYIAHCITQNAGSSAYFNGSVVSYSNEVKQQVLGVKASDLESHGAVSEPVVRQMVAGAIATLGVDYAVAVSGVAGPGGGSPEKPVGTVWIAVGNKTRTHAKRYQFPYDRPLNIEVTAIVTLNNLRKLILGLLEEE